jgi:hypothetical protein
VNGAYKAKLNSVALVRERTVPTELLPLVVAGVIMSWEMIMGADEMKSAGGLGRVEDDEGWKGG